MSDHKKIKVMHFIDSDGVYGAERVILNLSDELKKYPDLNVVVGCIVSDDNETNALYDAAVALDIEALRIPVRNSKLFFDLPRAAKLLKRHKIDLIHSHGYKPSVYGFIIKKLAGIQVMVTCHLWFEPKKGPLKMRVMVALEKLFFRWYPLIVTVSEPIKQTLVQHKIESDKIFVVENGVDISNDEANDDLTLKNELGIAGDTFVITNVGRLSRQKAQSDLISAAAQLKQHSENFVILIVGEGPLAESLQKQINKLGLEQQVRLLGYRQDIKKLLTISNIFALPSLDEGMPMAMLEATSVSVPVVTTAVGDIPKLIRDGESGLIVPVAEPALLAKAIHTIWQSPDLAEKFAVSAYKKMSEQYSNRVMGEKYSELYHRLLSTSNTHQEL